jgi:hypothetical protein
MRWSRHLRAQPYNKKLQGLQRGGHLRTQPQKENLQGLPTEGGLVLMIRTEDEGGGRTAGRTRYVCLCAC